MSLDDVIEQLDKIYITDLLLDCIIGINDWERTKKQPVVINITLYADLGRACQSDRIEDSVDYKEIKQQIIVLVEASNFFLIEKLADCITQKCLAHPFVKAAKVRVDKPGALRYAKSVGVEIIRIRTDV